VVSPETVVRRHRAGFRFYWTWLSRHQISSGRKRISKELRELIFKMVAGNPTRGAPRMHVELQKKVDRWKAFLRNDREVIAAMDSFTVHTVTFGILYSFSSLPTIVGAFFISTLRAIRRAFGPCNSCAKHFRSRALTNT
jgi:hypothetical protein